MLAKNFLDSPVTHDDARSLQVRYVLKNLYLQRGLWIGVFCEPRPCVKTAKERVIPNSNLEDQ